MKTYTASTGDVNYQDKVMIYQFHEISAPLTFEEMLKQRDNEVRLSVLTDVLKLLHRKRGRPVSVKNLYQKVYEMYKKVK